MKVKELIEALKYADPEYEVYSGYFSDNPLESVRVESVFEISRLTEVDTAPRDAGPNGVYLRTD